MKVLFVSSEAQPLVKTGGLADVSGALPAALKAARCNVRLMLPAYASVMQKLKNPHTIASIRLPGLPGNIELLEDKLPGSSVKLILVRYDAAFDRPGNPYLTTDGEPWPDNAERFCILSRAACEVAMNRAGLDWQPDIVHCNDWQTGLIPALLRNEEQLYTDDKPHRPAILFTIHNLAYQGLFSGAMLTHLGLPGHLWTPEALEFHGQLSFIKGGLVFADRINTVSSSYASEIQTSHFGYGLEGLLKHRSSYLSGIVNGIDDNEWNPETDPDIHHHYDGETLGNKQKNKTGLQQHFGLPVNKDAMLCGFIGRLVEQKGIDLIIEAMTQRLHQPGSGTGPGASHKHGNIQFVFLGSGEKHFEKKLTDISKQYPEHIGVTIGYDESLAHRIEAGADVFLMPSRFEPCGLNQLYSLRYGTLPVVHKVGGLSDTVTDADPAGLVSNTATGFVFNNDDVASLSLAINRAEKLFRTPSAWRQIMQTGMAQDFSWKNSARHYLKLYRTAIKDLKLASTITPKKITRKKVKKKQLSISE